VERLERRAENAELTERDALGGGAPRPAWFALAFEADVMGLALRRVPATALARAASAAVADGADTNVAGMVDVMSALERACRERRGGS
jgi:alpha-beta hydrolase superfamily lysophospholipase